MNGRDDDGGGGGGGRTAAEGTPVPVDVSRDVRARVIWAVLLAGPVIMITHFLLVYIVAEAGCTAAGQALAAFDPPAPAIVTAVATAVAAAACIAVIRWATTWWRDPRPDLEPSPTGGDLQGDEREAFRALGFIGLLLAVLSLLTVLAVGVSGLVFAGC